MLISKIVRVVDTVVHEEVRVADERIASRTVRTIHEACILFHLGGVQAVKPADCVINLANIDALEVVNLARLTKTALVNTLSDVRVAELAIDRLNETELATAIMIHFHCVLL